MFFFSKQRLLKQGQIRSGEPAWSTGPSPYSSAQCAADGRLCETVAVSAVHFMYYVSNSRPHICDAGGNRLPVSCRWGHPQGQPGTCVLPPLPHRIWYRMLLSLTGKPAVLSRDRCRISYSLFTYSHVLWFARCYKTLAMFLQMWQHDNLRHFPCLWHHYWPLRETLITIYQGHGVSAGCCRTFPQDEHLWSIKPWTLVVYRMLSVTTW